jgi:hypothetical protein
MAFELRNQRRQKVRYDSTNDDNKLVYQLVVNGAKVTPTSATIAISDPSGTSIVTPAAMTVSGTLLTYQLDTTTEADYPIATGYRGDIIVTYSALTYDRVIFFDVVRYLLDLNIGIDQLVAVDDSIKGMTWDGDYDFNAMIEGCRDYLQTRIESKVVNDGKLIENMILDNSGVSVAARFYILSQIMLGKRDMERHEIYKAEFESTLKSVLSSIRYDTGQDGTEPETYGGIISARLVT